MGQHSYLHCEPSQQQELDNLLWTFRQDSFIPHHIHDSSRVDSSGADSSVPVLIGQQPAATNTDDILLVLTPELPAESVIHNFGRLADFVCKGNTHDQQSGRIRYRWYQEHNIPILNHPIQL
jgi:DNA polymerase-3 subunit chi